MSELILLVDDEPSLQLTLRDTLTDEGYRVKVAGTVAEGLAKLRGSVPDLVLCDLRLPDGEGLEVVRAVQNITPETPVLILTAFGSVDSAVEALKLGATEYLTKPFEEEHLLTVIARYMEVRRLRRRLQELESGAALPLGDAPGFVRVLELARAVAASDSSVLVLGETGTGKEVVARYIHACSPRSDRAFVAVNCAALPETLLESELFGHERGAFTGAIRQRQGRFESADGGTLFLDEIAEMSQSTQAKLLRVLQEQRFERLGSNEQIQVDVRIIAATRRDIDAEVSTGRFRDDLYYRIKVVPIEIPPLRDRISDVAILASAFARRVSEVRGRSFTLPPQTVRCLEANSFPGNVRELENLVQRLAAVSPVETVLPEHLPEEYRRGCGAAEVQGTQFQGSLAEMAQAFERSVLEQVMERFDGHRGRMAQALGISRKGLWEKLKSHGLDR